MQLVPHLDDNQGDQDADARDVLAIARALKASGWGAVICASGGSRLREAEAIGAATLELPMDSPNPLVLWQNVGRLAQAVREHNVAIIHAYSPGAGWSGGFAAKRTNAAFMTTASVLPGEAANAFRKRYLKVMTAGERIIAPSEFAAAQLRDRLAIDPSRVKVIPQGVDLASMDTGNIRGHRIARLSERWKVSLERKPVLLAAPPGAAAHHLLALEAIAKIERDDFTLLLTGEFLPESAQAQSIMDRIEHLGLRSRVQFTGACDDLAAAYMMSEVVLVLGSDAAPFIRTAVEAQALGKPVIVSDVGGLAEAVLPASTGWIVPPDDVAELAWALELALSLAPAVKERLAGRAREFVRSAFSSEQMCRRTLAVYRELVPHAPRALAAGSAGALAP